MKIQPQACPTGRGSPSSRTAWSDPGTAACWAASGTGRWARNPAARHDSGNPNIVTMETRMEGKVTHKQLEVSGADQPVAAVVSWSTDHQQRRSGFDQRGQRVRLQGAKVKNLRQNGGRCPFHRTKRPQFIRQKTVSAEPRNDHGNVKSTKPKQAEADSSRSGSNPVQPAS